MTVKTKKQERCGKRADNINETLRKAIPEDGEIEQNIRWFRKFSVEERLKIAEKDSRIIKELRNLKITDARKRLHAS